MKIIDLYNRLGQLLIAHKCSPDDEVYWMSEEGEVNRIQSLFCGAPAELPECYVEEVFLKDGVIIEPEDKPVPKGFVPHDLEYVEYRTIVERREQSRRFSRPVVILNDVTYCNPAAGYLNGYYKVEDLPAKRITNQTTLAEEYSQQSDLRESIAGLDTNPDFLRYLELKKEYENVDLIYHQSAVAKRIQEFVNKAKTE